MKLAVYADLAPGGAAYALTRFLEHLPPSWEVTAFAPHGGHAWKAGAERVGPPEPAPLPGPRYYVNRFTRLRRLAALERAEAELARRAGAFDRWLVHSCRDRGAPRLLSELGDRAVFYCTEPLRLYREPAPPDSTSPWLRTAAHALYKPVSARLNAADARHGARAARSLANSNYTQGRCAAVYGTQPDVVYPSVDPRILDAPGGDGDGGYVLSPGALLPQKGHGRVLRALARLKHPPQLVIAGASGRPGYAKRMRTLAKKHGVSLRIVGSASHGDWVQLLRGARVVAIGAFREPFGLVSLEAQAVGRPVVVLDEGGLPETLAPGRTGFAVTEASFPDALAALLRDPGLAERLGGAGREWARANFHPADLGRQLAAKLSSG